MSDNEQDDVQLFARPKKKAKKLAIGDSGKEGQSRKGGEESSAGAREAKEAKGKRTPADKLNGSAAAHDKTASSTERGQAQCDADGGADEAAERSGGQASTSQGDDSIAPMDFKGLGLSEWLCGVCSSLGMSMPTEVQRGCIPAILAGRDVIGLAQTGSGKTAAFALPILQSLAKDPYGVYAVALTPTR